MISLNSVSILGELVNFIRECNMKFLIGVLVSALGASLRRVKSIFCLSASS
jgi:hypothetical protein